MKKKIMAMIVCAAVVLSLTACSSDSESSSPNTNMSTSTKSSTESSKTEGSSAASISSAENSSDKTSVNSKPEESSSERTIPKESSIPEPIVADEADFETETVDGGVCITKYKGNGENVIIPETIGGKKVVVIGENAFSSNNYIKSVTIPDGVASINYDFDYFTGAFRNCHSLKEIFFLGDDMPSLAYIAFEGSAWLKEKRKENPDYTIVNNMLLEWSKNEGDVTVPNGVTKIAPRAFDNMFENMDKITEITIPDSVTEIGEYAFHDCRGLKKITLSKNITKIAEGTFAGCVSLERIDIPNGVTSIGYLAFQYCGAVISIPDSVAEISSYLGVNGIKFSYKGKTYDSIFTFSDEFDGTFISDH